MYDDDYGDFVVHMSEDRGECDIALLFDARWIHGMEPFKYVERAMETAGPAFEGAWQQFGAVGSDVDAEAALDLIHQQMIAGRPCDLPETATELIVATLGGLPRAQLEHGLATFRRDGAFLGYIDISGSSEFRAPVVGRLDWVD